MSQSFIGEIRMFAGNFAPAGWMFCEGQTLPIAANPVLFQLIGTSYGGDGQSTFLLPDLRGRVPVHQGNGFALAQNGGVETVTLAPQQVASHNHPLQASTTTAVGNSPTNNLTGQTGATLIYKQASPAATMSPLAITDYVGGSQPHENMQPFICVNFIISLFGIFPSQ